MHVGKCVLFANSVFNPGKLIGYSRDTNSYKRGIYNPKGVGVKILLSLIDALTELKIIDEVHIAPRSNSSSRISSRFKISDKYLEEFISKAKKSPRVDIGPGIFVRDARGCLVDSVKEKATFLNMSKKLARINSTNEDSQYELLGEVLEPPVLKRVFNNSSLKLGGRFYSFGKNLYQSLKKREREKIKINSQDVIEIDFKSLHPNFLYAMKGIQLNRDAYSSLKNDKSLDRKALKKSFLIAINCKNENGAIMAIANDLKISRSESKHIMQEIFKSHQEIRDLFFSTNLALKLQFKDSTLAEMVMLKYIQSTRGGAILPVHDSFIVSQQNSPLLKEIMKESYKTLTGFEIEVE